MKKLSLIVCFFLLHVFSFAQEETLAIKNVSVIDVKHSKILNGRTVVIKGNRIASVNRKGNLPKNANTIDGKGKYLIPGLWDMHVHTLTRYEYAFPLLIANGVTGVREMGNNLSIEQVNQIRRDVEEGKILGPRLGAVTYHILDGPGTQLGVSVVISSPDSGRAIVQKYKQSGADFIKPYNLLSREVYLAIMDEAKKQGIPLEGHTPFSMSATEVSDLGQLVIEHNFGVLLSCSSSEKELREQTQTQTAPGFWLQTEAKAAATYDSQKAKKLCKQFARNGTWSCPTLSFQRLYPLDSNNSAAIAMQYIPETQLAIWQTGYERMLSNSLPEYRSLRYEMLRKIVEDMHRAGVGILAGTDMGAFYAFPGFSLHDELQELVKAGLTQAEALQTATLNPAKFLHKEKELGTIEKGKIADLVLLDANPLENISNTKKIFAVILNGRLLHRSDLDNLLRQTKEKAKKKEMLNNNKTTLSYEQPLTVVFATAGATNKT